MSCCNKNLNKNKVEVITGKLCYCFNYSENDFVQAIQKDCERELIKEIQRKMKDPGCFCESSNPSGKCCLADIKKFIKNERSKK